MKNLSTKLLNTALFVLTVSGPAALATADAFTTIHIVTQEIYDGGGYVVKSAPFIGCYGINEGPQVAQWTAEYIVPSNIGCGGLKYQENINALTCGQVTHFKEADNFMSIKEITLDISKCEAKSDGGFIQAIRTSANRNFPKAKLTILR